MTSITEQVIAEPEPDSLKPDLLKHLRSLNLNSIDEYREWCSRHGFSVRIQKHWRERLREHAWAGRSVAAACLARQKTESRPPERIIEGIRCGDLIETDFSQPHFIEICRQASDLQADEQTRAAFFELLQLTVQRRADFFCSTPVIGYLGNQPGNTFVAGLAAVARQSQHGRRSPLHWQPRTHNSRRQFSALLKHCFTRWNVPVFMEAAWFEIDPAKADQHQRWYLHVAKGESIRTTDVPLVYSKRMVHHFLQAPAHLPIEAALRWGQVLALGGNENLANAILASRLATDFEHDEFWTTFIRFFVEHPTLNPQFTLRPICDFAYNQKFVAVQGVNASGEIEMQPPPQPNFSLKGRTPESLQRELNLWHIRLRTMQLPNREWPPSNITPLKVAEGSATKEPLEWVTIELLTSNELIREGSAMLHCVAAYDRLCFDGISSIWSLQLARNGKSRRILTVEVNLPKRLIVQAKGRSNSLPKPKHVEILRLWATQASLSVAEWIS